MSRIFALCTLILMLLTFSSSAEKMLQFKFGPVWPRDLLGANRSTAWNGTVVLGRTFDKRFAVGGALDFLWNRIVDERRLAGNAYEINVNRRVFMFPLSGYVGFSPVPDLVVSPEVNAQVGFNTMYYFSRKDSSSTAVTDETRYEDNGWFMGLFWKIGTEANVRIGANSAFFTGLEYQWSRPRRLDLQNDVVVQRNMSGLGLRAGFKVSY